MWGTDTLDTVMVTHKVAGKEYNIEYLRSNRGAETLDQWPGGRPSIAGLSILDVGTGDGKFVQDFDDPNTVKTYGQPKRVVGMDISLRKWQQSPKYKGRFIKGDGLNLPFEDNEFDIYYCIQGPLAYFTPRWVNDQGQEGGTPELWGKALSEAYRVARKYVYFTTTAKMDVQKYEELLKDPRFKVVHPTPEEREGRFGAQMIVLQVIKN